jgi:hypothetical protein
MNAKVQPLAAPSFDSRKKAQKAQKQGIKDMPSPSCSFASFAPFCGHSNDVGKANDYGV